MKAHLNTFFVTTQGAYLSKEGETVVATVEKEKVIQLPIHTLSGIICFGRVTVSPFLIGHCSENNVLISFLTENGRFLGRVQGAVSGNVLLRREQYRRSDDGEEASRIAGFIVTGKLLNTRKIMVRAIREHGEKSDRSALEGARDHVTALLVELEGITELDRIRGIEGRAARVYFDVFNHLIIHQKEDFTFTGRSRRPPLDPVNALLSFLYTLLLHDVMAALESVGLDPQAGFLHRDRPGRPSFALDMMEEFRPVIVDRLVLRLINRREVSRKDFDRSSAGGILLKEKARRGVIIAYQERKKDEIQHPFIGEKVTVGQLFHVQALLFSRYLRGDLDGYPPFIL